MSTMPEHVFITTSERDGSFRVLNGQETIDYDTDTKYVLATRLAEVEAQLQAERERAEKWKETARRMLSNSSPHQHLVDYKLHRSTELSCGCVSAHWLEALASDPHPAKEGT